ncbi:anti-sigma factor [Paenibacillus sp. 19GGS1-52]|uniref:anti-sigma factor n=1 Tax=Paenibacillus sp. 19GGS1-52 TaxID=2758563 RepID=UPI001EFB9662|nr:anti-sigma factor [Paenibacillus sp. 19GGS1-52]ULO10603.1 anti-sigma factor [Paenibacillus sp. 19GGS1-52]
MDKTQDEFCEWAEIYALGGLDAEEQRQFEEHLSGCADCKLQLKELKKIIDMLPLAVIEVTPPDGMKNRVLGRVLATDRAAEISKADDDNSARDALEIVQEHEISAAPNIPDPAPQVKRHRLPSKRRNRLRMVCAGLAVVAVALTIYSAALQRDISGLRTELAASANDLTGLQEQLALAGAPSQELKVDEVVQLDPATQDIVARGLATIVIDTKGTHLLVQAEKLPELSGNEAFQVWLIKGDVKKSAGTFLSSQGTGAMYYTFDPQDYDTVAITLEPDGQGDQPRGKMILLAKIEG